jgi:hypothetical protein
MTASLRQQRLAIDPLAVFVARAEAKATLWAAGEISLHDAVDELWADAVRHGLVAKLGPDKVQQLLADAFASVRDDLLSDQEKQVGNANLNSADDEHDGLPSTFAKLCREADNKQRRKGENPHLEKLRRLFDDDVSIESAWHQVSRPLGVPIAMLWTAEFLLQQNDPARLKAWLARHSREQRKAIRKHL